MLIKDIVNKFSNPVFSQLPFFLITFVLLGGETLQNIHGRIITYSPTVTWYDLSVRLFTTFFITYLLTVLVHLVNRTYFKVLAYTFVLILYSIYLFLRYNFGLQISPTILLLLAETSETESKEFIRTFILTGYGIQVAKTVGVIILVILFSEWLIKKKGTFLKKKDKVEFIISSFFGCFVFIGFLSMTKNVMFLYKCDSTDDFINIDSYNWFPNDPISRLLYSFYGVHIMNNEQTSAEQLIEELQKTKVSLINTDSLNIVVVIGESYIKAHSGLYGYRLNTTPFLMKEKEKGNLFVFSNVITPFNITTLAMKNALCTNSISDGESWSKSQFFPAIFKRAGYDVYMWDNQKTWGDGTSFVLSLNSFLYGKVVANHSYTRTNNRSYDYDEDIITSFDSIQINNKHNLVIFHLMGQHVDVEERYPHNSLFNHFTKDSINRKEPYITDNKRELIASYDNATLYNDYVMKLIIDRFNNSNSLILYFSDHGDEVYDYRDSAGRVKDNMSPNSVKFQYEVPFVVWCSDTFKNKYPQIVAEIDNAKDRPFMTDIICNFLFYIGGIKTSYYRPYRNPIHKTFSTSDRMIEYVYNYDSIMGRHK